MSKTNSRLGGALLGLYLAIWAGFAMGCGPSTRLAEANNLPGWEYVDKDGWVYTTCSKSGDRLYLAPTTYPALAVVPGGCLK
jgi:hypothetical protein